MSRGTASPSPSSCPGFAGPGTRGEGVAACSIASTSEHVNEVGSGPRSTLPSCGLLVVASLMVVTAVAALLTVLWAVGYWEPDPSIEVEDTGASTTLNGASTTGTTVGSAPGEHAWDALPDDLEVALGVLAAVPTTTTTTTTAPVLAPPVAEVRPSPDPAPTPTVQGGDSIEALICSVDWSCARALAVARCESQLDPNAVGRAGERGLFQVHPVHRGWLGARWDALFDPATNVAVAHEMWRTQGWAPWSCA